VVCVYLRFDACQRGFRALQLRNANRGVDAWPPIFEVWSPDGDAIKSASAITSPRHVEVELQVLQSYLPEAVLSRFVRSCVWVAGAGLAAYSAPSGSGNLIEEIFVFKIDT